jgi:hypothetical protein
MPRRFREPKLVARYTVVLDQDVSQIVEEQAKARRVPVSTLLRMIVSEYALKPAKGDAT